MTAQLPLNYQSLAELYEQDFHLWLETTTNLLSEGKFNQLDTENLIEEIQGMSRREKETLESNLIWVLQHLLKWHYQPQKRSNSWGYSIYEHSRRLNKAFKNSPSLRRYFDEIFDDCYQEAINAASLETGLPFEIFPKSCPFSQETVLKVNREDYLILFRE